MAADIRGIDVDNVSRWLAEHIAGAEPPFTFELIAGGHSNLTYRVVDRNGTPYVLRRPPMGFVLATAHDMAREHRIISSIGRSNVPVPPALGLCTDEAVNGAPFYVMAYVAGTVLDTPDKAEPLATADRQALAFDLIDVLADLHAVDIDAIGLGDLAKRTGYVERQLKRWAAQWENSKTRELPAIDELIDQLRRRMPEQVETTIAHGDYRFGNCLADLSRNRIAAVLDWELCTLGEPLADLGYIGVYWTDGSSRFGRANDPTAAGGFPTHAQLVERYAVRTGRDVSNVGFYVAFSAFRLAVISEGVYARYLKGVMGEGVSSDRTDMFESSVAQLTESALVALAAVK
jgi:aminoglycoside phosphotransferase (APT) family kinase protein